MKTVYVASALQNHHTVLGIQARLEVLGVATAFDWAGHYSRQLADGRKLSPDEKAALAAAMEKGVRTADVFLLLAPGRRGAHVELGIAIGCNKPVVIYSRDEAEDISFYLLPGVKGLYRTMWDAVEAVVTIAERGAAT